MSQNSSSLKGVTGVHKIISYLGSCMHIN